MPELALRAIPEMTAKGFFSSLLGGQVIASRS
jgi:hypothetical protein